MTVLFCYLDLIRGRMPQASFDECLFNRPKTTGEEMGFNKVKKNKTLNKLRKYYIKLLTLTFQRKIIKSSKYTRDYLFNNFLYLIVLIGTTYLNNKYNCNIID